MSRVWSRFSTNLILLIIIIIGIIFRYIYVPIAVIYARNTPVFSIFILGIFPLFYNLLQFLFVVYVIQIFLFISYHFIYIVWFFFFFPLNIILYNCFFYNKLFINMLNLLNKLIKNNIIFYFSFTEIYFFQNFEYSVLFILYHIFFLTTTFIFHIFYILLLPIIKNSSINGIKKI